jgi:hypothetical protein
VIFTEQKRKAVINSVEKVTELMVNNLNNGVAHVFANQKKIELVLFPFPFPFPFSFSFLFNPLFSFSLFHFFDELFCKLNRKFKNWNNKQ